MEEKPCALCDSMYSMPSAAAMARSKGVVMKPRTRSALAPTYAVETVTTEFSLRGYCRTVKPLLPLSAARMAWVPAMMMTRLTTMARTGRRMKMSVNDEFMGVGDARWETAARPLRSHWAWA